MLCCCFVLCYPGRGLLNVCSRWCFFSILLCGVLFLVCVCGGGGVELLLIFVPGGCGLTLLWGTLHPSPLSD